MKSEASNIKPSKTSGFEHKDCQLAVHVIVEKKENNSFIEKKPEVSINKQRSKFWDNALKKRKEYNKNDVSTKD